MSSTDGPQVKAHPARGVRPGTQEEQRLLETVVSIVRRAYAPQRIILFGSRAHGTAHPASDADVLVILPPAQATTECWEDLLDRLARLAVDVDVVLSTPDEVSWRSELPGFVEYDAIHHGQVLYEQR